MLDYEVSKEIAEMFYRESFSYWRTAGMNDYQAIRKAEQEVLELKYNPFGKGMLDVTACKDFVEDMLCGAL